MKIIMKIQKKRLPLYRKAILISNCNNSLRTVAICIRTGNTFIVFLVLFL
jgi:hypothetical protein